MRRLSKTLQQLLLDFLELREGEVFDVILDQREASDLKKILTLLGQQVEIEGTDKGEVRLKVRKTRPKG